MYISNLLQKKKLCAQTPYSVAHQRPISAALVRELAVEIWHRCWGTCWLGQLSRRACIWGWRWSWSRREILQRLLSATAKDWSTSTHCQTTKWRWWLKYIKAHGNSCQNTWSISFLCSLTAQVQRKVRKMKGCTKYRLPQSGSSDHRCFALMWQWKDLSNPAGFTHA